MIKSRQSGFICFFLLTAVTSMLLSCPTDHPAGAGSKIAWQGFWYDPASPEDRGTFSADLDYTFFDESDYGEISGAMAFSGHAAGTLTVTGNSHAAYNPLYCHMDLADGTGAWEVSGVEYDTWYLSSDSLLSGSLQAAGEETYFSFYPVPTGMGIPPLNVSVTETDLDPAIYVIAEIAVSDQGDTWVIRRHDEGGGVYTYALMSVDSAGNTAAIGAAPVVNESLAWGDGKLWLADKYESSPGVWKYRLSAYDDTAYSLESQIDFADAEYGSTAEFHLAYTAGDMIMLEGQSSVYLIDTQTGTKSEPFSGPYFQLQDIAVLNDGFIADRWSGSSYPNFLDTCDAAGALVTRYTSPVYASWCMTSNSASLFVVVDNKILEMPLGGFYVD